MRQADLIEREQGTEPVELFALETESTGTEISGGGERGLRSSDAAGCSSKGSSKRSGGGERGLEGEA